MVTFLTICFCLIPIATASTNSPSVNFKHQSELSLVHGEPATSLFTARFRALLRPKRQSSPPKHIAAVSSPENDNLRALTETSLRRSSSVTGFPDQESSFHELRSLQEYRLKEHQKRVARARQRLHRHRRPQKHSVPAIDVIFAKLPPASYRTPKVVGRPSRPHYNPAKPLKGLPGTFRKPLKNYPGSNMYPIDSLGAQLTKTKTHPGINLNYRNKFKYKTPTSHLEAFRVNVNPKLRRPTLSEKPTHQIQTNGENYREPKLTKRPLNDLSQSSSLLSARPFHVQPSGIHIEQINMPNYSEVPLSQDSPLLNTFTFQDSNTISIHGSSNLAGSSIEHSEVPLSHDSPLLDALSQVHGEVPALHNSQVFDIINHGDNTEPQIPEIFIDNSFHNHMKDHIELDNFEHHGEITDFTENYNFADDTIEHEHHQKGSDEKEDTLFYSSVQPIKFKPKVKIVSKEPDRSRYVDLTDVLHKYVSAHRQKQSLSLSDKSDTQVQSGGRAILQENAIVGPQDVVVDLTDGNMVTWESFKTQVINNGKDDIGGPKEGYEKFQFAGEVKHDTKGAVFIYENGNKNQIMLPCFNCSETENHGQTTNKLIQPQFNRIYKFNHQDGIVSTQDGNSHNNKIMNEGSNEHQARNFLEHHGFSFHRPHPIHTLSKMTPESGRLTLLDSMIAKHNTRVVPGRQFGGSIESFPESLTAHETRVFQPSSKIPDLPVGNRQSSLIYDGTFNPPQASYGGFKPLLKSNGYEDLIYYSRRKRGSSVNQSIRNDRNTKRWRRIQKRSATPMVMSTKEEVTLNPLTQPKSHESSTVSSDEQYRILADIHRTMEHSLEMVTENETTTTKEEMYGTTAVTTSAPRYSEAPTTESSTLKRHTVELIKQLTDSGSISERISQLPNAGNGKVTGYLIPKKGGQVLPLNTKTRFIVRGGDEERSGRHYRFIKNRANRTLGQSKRSNNVTSDNEESSTTKSTEKSKSNKARTYSQKRLRYKLTGNNHEENVKNKKQKEENEDEKEEKENENENVNENENEEEEKNEQQKGREKDIFYDDGYSGHLFPHREPYGHNPYHHYRPYRHSILLQMIRRVARGFNRLFFGRPYADHIEYQGLHGYH